MTLLPPNATPLERALEAATARLGDVPSPLRPLVDPDTCPADLLPYLAWAVAIDGWSEDWPEPIRRARVHAAIPIQRRKGTVASIRDLVASFGGGFLLREWWQFSPPRRPYTFALVIDVDGVVPGDVNAAYVEAIGAEVARTKPVRCSFTLTQKVRAGQRFAAVAAARPAAHARLAMVA